MISPQPARSGANTGGGGPPSVRVPSEAGEQLCVLDGALVQSLVIAVLFQKLEKYLRGRSCSLE